MISKNENGQFVFPNGKQPGPGCMAVLACVMKPDFYSANPPPMYTMAVNLYFTLAEDQLAKQERAKGVETSFIANARHAIELTRGLINKVRNGVKQDQVIDITNDRSGITTSLPMCDQIVNHVCYIELCLTDPAYIKQKDKTGLKKATGGVAFPQYQPVMVQISKAFGAKLFKHLKWQVSVETNGKDYFARSAAFSKENDAEKYLTKLQVIFPCATLLKDNKHFRLKVPDLEMRLKDIDLGLRLRKQSNDNKPIDADYSQRVAQAKNRGCLNHAGGGTGLTALHRAVMKGNQDKAECLLHAGADTAREDKDGLSVLHHAAKQRNEEMVVLLLKYGADPSQQNKAKEVKTPAELTDSENIKALLTKNADLDLN